MSDLGRTASITGKVSPNQRGMRLLQQSAIIPQPSTGVPKVSEVAAGAAKPSVALFCATFLKPEMLHVYRHVTGLENFRPVVVAQKCEGDWPVGCLVPLPRSSGRFLARAKERFTQRPWQISAVETRRFLAILEQERCEVLHIFFGNVAVHWLPLLRVCPVPVVVSFHGSDVAGSMISPGYAEAVAEMFRLATVVPCRSVRLMESVAGLGGPVKKLRLMRTILPELPTRKRTPPTDGAWRIVQAARLVPKKGIVAALRAFAVLAEQCPRSTFTIAGEGPMEESLRRLAEELKIDARVEFTGFLSQEELQALFSEAHIFLHPSEAVNGDVEGVPNAMLEAMAMGIPVVATRHGGIPEVVVEGETGLLTEEADVEALAAALVRLAGDANFYRRLSENAAISVREQFSADRQIAAVEEIYREAILARSGGNPAA